MTRNCSAVAEDHPITDFLEQWTHGDHASLDHLFPIIYQQLKSKAHFCLQSESQATLQTTSLINEVYLRLCESHNLKFNNRLQFLAFAGQLMHRILIERARARNASKRGGKSVHISLEDQDFAMSAAQTDPEALLLIDEVLQRLGSFDRRKFQIVQLWFFAGLDAQEIGSVLTVSAATIRRELQAAKCWMAFELK